MWSTEQNPSATRCSPRWRTSSTWASVRSASQCEHVVPWAIQGAHWEAGALAEPPEVDAGPLRCSHCDAELGDVHVLLVRHRGEHRVADAFCSVEHMSEWAKAGGRWQ